MGVDIFNEKYGMHFSHGDWSSILGIAQDYGWKPLDTQVVHAKIRKYVEEGGHVRKHLKKLMDEWDGNYCSNRGQEVLTEDSSNLTDALTRSLEDMPKTNVFHKTTLRKNGHLYTDLKDGIEEKDVQNDSLGLAYFQEKIRVLIQYFGGKPFSIV